MSSADAWGEFAEEMNRQTMENYQRSVDAQAAFVESWVGAFEEETAEEAMEGYGRAYEAWLDAAEEGSERLAAMAEGEGVEPEELREIWLSAANESAKELMGTTAFAAATGRSVEATMTALREAEDASVDTLRTMGIATRDDVEEVGERLLELERRQQRVEEKLDRLLDDRDE